MSKTDITDLAAQVVDFAYEQAESYQTNEVIFMWGDDFAHKHANLTYGLMNKIIEEIQSGETFKNLNITIQYY